jgi:acetyl esterase/lipase
MKINTLAGTILAAALLLPASLAGAASNVAAVPLSAPANDAIGGAVVINGLPYTSPMLDVSQATEDSSDPSYPSYCYNSPGTSNKPYRTVWYKYTASQTTMIRVTTEDANTDYDTVLAVWHGSPGSLILTGCNDDISGSQQSALDALITQSTTYYIEVGAFSAVESGHLVLHLEGVTDLVYIPLVYK